MGLNNVYKMRAPDHPGQGLGLGHRIENICILSKPAIHRERLANRTRTSTDLPLSLLSY